MTNFETLKIYVKAQLQKIVSLELEMNQKISDCKFTTISGNKFFVGAEIWAAKKRAIQDDYNARIKAIHDEIAAKLDAAQKEANQEYYAAIPRPDAEERAEIASLIREYNNSDAPDKELAFVAERDFHIENETRMARIYIFAGKELGITKAKAENHAEGGTAEDQRMNAIHMATANITACAKLEQDELLLKIAPAMKDAQDHIDMVIDARRFYAIFDLLAIQEKAIYLTPENFRQDGAYSSWDEVRATQIAIKNRLFEMGADPAMDLYTFVNSDLQ